MSSVQNGIRLEINKRSKKYTNIQHLNNIL